MKMFHNTRAVIFCIFIFFLFGCTSASMSTTPKIDNIPITSSSTLAPNAIASRSITIEKIPTSFAPVGTEIPSPTLSPMVTSIPTIAEDYASDEIKKILTSDSICYLPCFGGITPGRSSMEQAESFFASFSQDIYKNQNINGFTAELKPPIEYDGGSNVFVTFLGGRIVSMIYAFRYDFSIGELLDTYGQPDNVYFYLQDPPPPWDKIARFEFVFDYSSKGFVANYVGEVVNGNVIEICSNISLERYNGPYLILWIPGTIENLKDLDKSDTRGFIGDIERYVSLKTAIKDPMEKFFQVFSSPGVCVEINNPNSN